MSAVSQFLSPSGLSWRKWNCLLWCYQLSETSENRKLAARKVRVQFIVFCNGLTIPIAPAHLTAVFSNLGSIWTVLFYEIHRIDFYLISNISTTHSQSMQGTKKHFKLSLNHSLKAFMFCVFHTMNHVITVKIQNKISQFAILKMQKR